MDDVVHQLNELTINRSIWEGCNQLLVNSIIFLNVYSEWDRKVNL